MLNDIISDKASQFGRCEHTELRAQMNTSVNVTINGGVVVGNSRSENSGVSCRVLTGGACGFASSSEYNEDAVKDVIRAAKDNAGFMAAVAPTKKELRFPDAKRSFDDKICYTPAPQKLYADFARGVDDYIAKKYKNLSNRVVCVRCDSMEKLLTTEAGYTFHTTMPRSYVYIFMEAKTKDNGPVELFRAVGGFGSFEENFPSYEDVFSEADKLYEKIMKKSEGVYADAGNKTCILSGNLSGMLAHEAVGHTTEADLVIGGSVAAHNLGRQVASPLISMTDFANTAYGERVPLPLWVDDEGIVCRDTKIIENGILVGYMNNADTALRFGMDALGNARAFSYSDEPLIRMRNTAILKGNSHIEDMIASVEDGYYLTDTNNGQADTSGEFMFGVSMGYEIKNGRLGRAILDTTISGIAFDMLKTVDMVADTMEWESSGFCGKKQPMPVGLGGPAIKCKVNIGGR
ncbi:MAG: TldD/PmbA family protein [Eubacteriales bacterium]|nr:TldD/PmbA family protein [Eubacteriales bacterium]